jgi:ATP-dependent helicase HrpB
MLPKSDLPIEDVIPQILEALREKTRLVISAPPGAGKTTRVPLTLLDEAWPAGRKLILVEPRRIAARAAAERMAATIGGRIGETIGLRSRLDVRTSKDSRIEVVTEGVFSRMILSDPSLEGIAAVIFDEFHERSLDADEGLAFALDAQSVLREDLRIVLMSATLPGNLTQAFFEAPVVESLGRAHSVETRYLGYEPRQRMEDQVAAAIRTALREEPGSILAFLPGVAEIQRTADRIGPVADNVLVAPLYGALSPQEQNEAIAPPKPGQRKVVLATDIAESALTIEGVRVVVDSGFARVPRFDPQLGASRLETVRLAVANADQRRGRAGRTGPGVCYRLWREAEMRGFASSPSPEIDNADLTGLALDVARWGAKSPADLRWLNPPREAPWRHARGVLAHGGAMTANGELTALGKRLGDLALPPRLALMVLRASELGEAQLAADIAALMSERELGGRSADVDERLNRFRQENGQRAKAMRDLSKRWARSAGGGNPSGASAGAVLALAFPERIAKARGGSPGRFVLSGGRGVMLDETDPLAREQWLAVADMTGSGPDLRITLAARLSEDDALQFGGAETKEEVRYDPVARRVRGRRVKRIGAIILEETPLPSPKRELVREGLIAAVRENSFDILPNASDINQLIARVALLYATLSEPWPANFRATLIERLDDWLGPLLESAGSFDALDSSAVMHAAAALLDWPLPRDLDALAPHSWTAPVGRRIAIDYTAEGGPRVELKVQEVYGASQHPMIIRDKVPLTLALLSPAQRPVAVTKDLPSFWRAGYHDMRKDMKGRYPKHDWPEDPVSATPTSRAKPRGT